MQLALLQGQPPTLRVSQSSLAVVGAAGIESARIVVIQQKSLNLDLLASVAANASFFGGVGGSWWAWWYLAWALKRRCQSCLTVSFVFTFADGSICSD